jgi:hypothetical protein
MVPIHHPRTPATRKLWITGFRVPRNAPNTPKTVRPHCHPESEHQPAIRRPHVHLSDFPTHPAIHCSARIGAHAVARVVVDINLAA